MKTMPQTEKAMDEALSLPADRRIELVDRLLQSLNLPTRREIDRAWAVEAEKRIDEIESGKARLIPGEVVFAKIRRKRK